MKRQFTKYEARSKDNKLYYDPTYRFSRTAVLKRDKYRCVLCKFPKYLSVHHIIPKRANPAMACVEENMVTLCQRCHTKVEEKRIRVKFKVENNKALVIWPEEKKHEQVAAV